MFQQFFTNTIENKFIKKLISDTELPIIPTVDNGDYIIKDVVYIFKAYIIRCTLSGIINAPASGLFVGENVLCSEYLPVSSGFKSASFTVVNTYIFGNHYNNITEKYVSKNSFYDSETHYYLGTYLRCIRDLYGVNMMPFYNCFNYKVVSDFYLSSSATYGYISGQSEAHKIIAVPIKFNKKYTIAIDCSTDVIMKSVVYGKLGMISSKLESNKYMEISKCMLENNGLTYVHYGSMGFKNPIVYEYDIRDHADSITEKELKSYEKYLYLIIQLPKNNKSSIVVLEGNYTDTSLDIVMNAESIDDAYNSDINKFMYSKLSLLMINDKNSYAFSSRLIEYLLCNVIDYHDEIYQNIERVQKYTKSIDYIDGIFNNYLRYLLYRRCYNDKSVNMVDINGFVDKVVEKEVTKGWDV